MAPNSRTPQEKLVSEFSRHILGKQALFYPDRFGVNANEPADLAWVVNRCAILMYMTSGSKRYLRKREHNLRQLRRWLKTWKRTGVILCGSSGSTQYRFLFSDVDHIVGLSIVDEGETGCEYHYDQVVEFSDYKLAACATITSSSLHILAATIAGPRDLLFWLTKIYDCPNGVVTERELSELIHTTTTERFSGLLASAQKTVAPAFDFQAMLKQAFELFSSLKTELEEDEKRTEVVADLGMAEILWLSVTSATLGSSIALPGETGGLVSYSRRDTGFYELQCMSAADISLVPVNVSRLVGINRLPGVALVSFYAMNPRIPFYILIISPRESGVSMLTLELEALRTRTLARQSPKSG